MVTPIKNHILTHQKNPTLQNDDFSLRTFSSTTLAMDSRAIPLAREKIAKFREEITEIMEKFSDPKEVYHLSVQLFPLTKIAENQETQNV